MKITKKIFCVPAIMFTLSACSSPAFFTEVKNNVDKTVDRVQVTEANENTTSLTTPVVIVKDELYVDTTPIDLSKHPVWLNNPLSLRGEKLPFLFYASNIVKSARVISTYQAGLNLDLMVDMDYSGTLQGALDVLAAKTGYQYRIDGDTLVWEAYVTKTFNIAFMPSSSQYFAGKDNFATGAGYYQVREDSPVIKQDQASWSENQYSHLKTTLSVWKDISDVVHTMLSPKGKAVISESTSSITVTDHPANMDVIARYIEETNLALSKQVMIKVQVLRINLQENFSNGINWDFAKTLLRNTHFTFSGDFSSPISIAPIAGASNTSFGEASGASQALIAALSQQGHISITTEPTVVTTNNQVASLSITTQTGYLAKASTTVNDATTTTELIPGQINAGLTLFLLPKIMDNKIYLQVSSSLSSLQKIQNIYATNKDGSQKIQVPIITDNTFNQRSVITSGSTLILAGFKQVQNETNNSAFTRIDSPVNQDALHQNIQTLILITPYVLNNH